MSSFEPRLITRAEWARATHMRHGAEGTLETFRPDDGTAETAIHHAPRISHVRVSYWRGGRLVNLHIAVHDPMDGAA